ncbi:serine--tRNA ligase [Kordiimonas sp. SCSIO 12603]|uniref:serine--tRNA ligase n=1 Tax=Kordiimonas sp. SCSIO 12603 TaxID=2829596 RepID=UPI002106F257|nr:serine--tRNA ligase [Kordiimonas sp. SCSIO 12603]UTW57682.1 serine--tRNA ligase [Kordiimonas sp. SCSIO 12603]
MFDLKFIRENPEAFDAALARRGEEARSAEILKLDSDHRSLATEAQTAQARRNEASKLIGKAKGQGNEEEAQALMAEVAELKTKLADLEEKERALGAELNNLLMSLPNMVYDDIPDGDDEEDNEEVRAWGKPAAFDFDAKEHFDIGEALGMMDFERAAKLSGSRFVVLKGGLARLERAIGQFMIDLHVNEHGYEEMVTPVMVRDSALYGTGQLPKFGEDAFKTTTDHWLIPTSEVTLTNLHSGEILDEATLPLRFTALSQCFRAEAGSAGRDTRGMIRQHQFAKVEMVSVTTPEQSDEELERMTGCAEEVLKRLHLPYRVVKLCTGDIGFGARRTYDLEVYLPGQGRYREISSCSVMGDFQARRMKMRCRPKGEKKTTFVHTLNGSGLAVGRTLIAVIENYQQADGTIRVPEALRSYMGGVDVIGA